MSANYIYTEKNDCRDCYKCIRECPVKAIKMENESASIIQENCIYCGHCASVCPVEAKKVKDETKNVEFLLNNYNKVIVSLAPSWATEFPEFSVSEITLRLKEFGFFAVSETALGAEIVSEYISKEIYSSATGVYISPCCPAIVELIHKYYPQHTDKIINVDTPMLAHGKFLKEYYGDDIKVVFAGPCIAKMNESGMNEGIIDSVITFNQLRKYLNRKIELKTVIDSDKEYSFEPFLSDKGALYPVSGGMIAGVNSKRSQTRISFMSFTGLSTIMPVLEDLDELQNHTPVFLELMSCPEGCINGPGTQSGKSLAIKRSYIIDNYYKNKPAAEKAVLKGSVVNKYNYGKAIESGVFAESEIIETLKSVGKQSQADELNCGGCGYENCRDFAKAILSGKAEQKMCVSYMRRVAQDKASTLLQRMPYGVVIVDKEMRVIESNRIFAELAGEEATLAYEAKPGLEGADLTKLIPFHHYFSNLFNSGESVLEKDIFTGNHFLHLSIFTLDVKNLQCAIVHNLRTPELKREEIVKRTRKVVRENLETVQKIAFLLGENASNMETLLNSIVNIQDDVDE